MSRTHLQCLREQNSIPKVDLGLLGTIHSTTTVAIQQDYGFDLSSEETSTNLINASKEDPRNIPLA